MVELDGKGMSVPMGQRKDFIDGAFTSNHDVMRAINQANGSGDENGTAPAETITWGDSTAVNKAKIHAAVTVFNQGISWIYYGDELGMTSNTEQHIPKYEYENCIDIWYRQPFLWNNTSLRPNYKDGQYAFELDSYNTELAKNNTYEAQRSKAGSMWQFYERLTYVKSLYPKSAKITYMESNADVLVIKVTGKGKSLAIYINVGRDTNNYTMDPVSLLGTNVANVWAYNASDAPLSDIGHSAYGISVFQEA